MTVKKPVLCLAAVLTLLAAATHFVAAPDHFQEWWGYGTFMLIVAIAQTLFAPALILTRSHASFRKTVLAGLIGNLAILTLYAVTRTIGIPPVGPSAGEVEGIGEMGGIDVIAGLAEAALIGVLFGLWTRAGQVVHEWAARSEGEVAGSLPMLHILENPLVLRSAPGSDYSDRTDDVTRRV